MKLYAVAAFSTYYPGGPVDDILAVYAEQDLAQAVERYEMEIKKPSRDDYVQLLVFEAGEPLTILKEDCKED
jgi:hypothetical protein